MAPDIPLEAQAQGCECALLPRSRAISSVLGTALDHSPAKSFPMAPPVFYGTPALYTDGSASIALQDATPAARSSEAPQSAHPRNPEAARFEAADGLGCHAHQVPRQEAAGAWNTPRNGGLRATVQAARGNGRRGILRPQTATAGLPSGRPRPPARRPAAAARGTRGPRGPSRRSEPSGFAPGSTTSRRRSSRSARTSRRARPPPPARRSAT